MSQENAELVRRLLEMFKARDHEAVFAFYASDIEWDARSLPAFGMPDELQDMYRGHDGVRTYWRRWLQAWTGLEFDVQDVLDAGDDVLVLIHNQRQLGRRSGVPIELPPYGLQFTVRDGLVTRWKAHPDHESALAAVGLSE
jgi:ketosteroid isomerase-like protein